MLEKTVTHIIIYNNLVVVLFFIIIVRVSGEYGGNYNSQIPALAPALFVFGDSIVDNGNNNVLLTLAKANYAPYGHDFAKGPTGRFTNGKTVADFIAEYLGLPYPRPYKNVGKKDSVEGYNYASGSCGILPETGRKYGRCLSLDVQMNLFEETRTKVLVPSLQAEQLPQHLANSIFLFVVGSNDYLSTYSKTSSQRDNDPNQFAQLLLNSFSQNLQRLYELGGRKVIVSDIGPLGCVPSVAKRSGTCDEYMNQVVSIFNTQLATMLQNLTSTLQGSHFLLVQSNNITYDTILHPTNYGLSESSSSCCVTGGDLKLLKGLKSPLCLPEIRDPCSNPNSYFFWDDVHPTEAVYSMTASRIINGSSSSTFSPMNLEQLLQA